MMHHINSPRSVLLAPVVVVLLVTVSFLLAVIPYTPTAHAFTTTVLTPTPSSITNARTTLQRRTTFHSPHLPKQTTLLFQLFSSSRNGSDEGYIPPEKSQVFNNNNNNSRTGKKPPQPKVGDIVLYYDLDGGKTDGQELVGKISFIQYTSNKWVAEITELEDVGDGYYTDYPSRKKRKSKLLSMENISPLIASYVRSEDAYKIPLNAMGRPSPYYTQYDLENYQGPSTVQINQQVLEEDSVLYNQLKIKLLKDAAIFGLVGTVIANFVKGLDDALIYFAGAVAGIGYLFFLSIKTDTVGSVDAKLGSNVSNLRFGLPLLVLVGVAIQNLSAGDSSPVIEAGYTLNVLRTVTPEQFAAAMLGFLTYRIPLFISQLGPLISDSATGMVLPGSAGMAMQMASSGKQNKGGRGQSNIFGEELTTILLVSGPIGAGKSELVKRLIEGSEGKLVPPKRVDIVAEPMLYEQLVSRDEILQVDSSGRYALTKDGILSAAARKGQNNKEDGDGGGDQQQQVVVVDADVNLCKKLVNIGGTRIVGVWVGLDAVEKFEASIEKLLDSGEIKIPENETKETVLRAKLREIVKDIEYGVVSGIFEFTVLNDDFDASLLQLKNAADYCFE